MHHVHVQWVAVVAHAADHAQTAGVAEGVFEAPTDAEGIKTGLTPRRHTAFPGGGCVVILTVKNTPEVRPEGGGVVRGHVEAHVEGREALISRVLIAGREAGGVVPETGAEVGAGLHAARVGEASVGAGQAIVEGAAHPEGRLAVEIHDCRAQAGILPLLAHLYPVGEVASRVPVQQAVTRQHPHIVEVRVHPFQGPHQRDDAGGIVHDVVHVAGQGPAVQLLPRARL